MSNKEKQIEEMARALGKGRSQNCEHYVSCSACPCDFCCIFQENAHILVQEGYHKASEIFADIETCMKNFEDDDDGYLLKKCEFEYFMRELKKEYESSYKYLESEDTK